MRRAPVTVRDAVSADIPRIREVAAASWQNAYAGIFTPEFIDDFVSRAYAAEALERSLAHAAEEEDVHFLVAERDGAIVGYLHFGSGEHGPELYRLYADPAHYGTGVGEALLAELDARLAGRVPSYVLYVHERNDRGRRFYERHGFVEAGRRGGSECEPMLRRSLPSGAAAATQLPARNVSTRST